MTPLRLILAFILALGLAACAVSGVNPIPGLEFSGAVNPSLIPPGVKASGDLQVDAQEGGCALLRLIGLADSLGVCAEAPAEPVAPASPHGEPL